METILLLDGKNTAYRSLFASRGNPDFSRIHPFVSWLRFTNVWLEKFKPSAVHVFWDCPKDDIWRKKILMEYKDNRDGMPHYADEIRDEIHKLIDVAKMMLPYMGMHQYSRAAQECDDLIYAMCRILTPPRSDMRKVIIISSDSDFLQIQWAMPHVVVYDPRTNELMAKSDVNPVVMKALAGDKSDNVDGYRGIGPVKAGQLASDAKKLVEFLEATGDQKFKRNLALVDMSLNPSRLSNELYVTRAMTQDVQLDKAKIDELAMSLHVAGLSADFSRFMMSLRRLQ